MSEPVALEPETPSPQQGMLAPGEVVDGRYRIESYLGGGGMASVYLATHLGLEQSVALKVVAPVVREVPGVAQRFLREARASLKLKSSHVVRVFDVGSMPDGAPYMVMEYLEGKDLDDLLAGGWRPTVDEAVEYVLQACEALAEVHGLGIIHRDLKPANLFLTRGADGLPTVKLIDFGISRVEDPLGNGDLMGLTHPDVVLGSPRYMSPEMMESATKADARSDIWGMGAVLYELIVGNAPYDGTSLESIYIAAIQGPPPAPSTLRAEVPPELDAVILRCLSLDPADRFSNVAELATALAPFAEESVASMRAAGIARVLDAARTRDAGVTPPTESSSQVRRRSSRSAQTKRNRSIVVAVVAVAMVVAVVAFGERALRAVAGVSTTTTTQAEVPPAVVPPASVPAPVEPAPAPSTTTIAPAALVTATGLATAPPVTAIPPTPPRREAPVEAPVSPPPMQTPSAPPPPPPFTPSPAPTPDERRLFEDRQ